jgi:hypothetical protein
VPISSSGFNLLTLLRLLKMRLRNRCAIVERDGIALLCQAGSGRDKNANQGQY